MVSVFRQLRSADGIGLNIHIPLLGEMSLPPFRRMPSEAVISTLLTVRKVPKASDSEIYVQICTASSRSSICRPPYCSQRIHWRGTRHLLLVHRPSGCVRFRLFPRPSLFVYLTTLPLETEIVEECMDMQ